MIASGHFTEGIFIVVIVVLNISLSVFQERKASNAVSALKSLSAPHAKVLRDGELENIDSKELVPGDIVIIEAGDYMPADLRLLETVNLKIDESALTGESVPVEKDYSVQLEEPTPIGDRLNMGYMSTIVTYGRATGLVVSTGMDTEIGNIATLLNDVEDELTPLQKQAYSYAKERFGFEDAKNSLDQIKTLTTREEFSNWVKKKIEDEKGLNENATTDIEAKIKSGEIDPKEIEAAAKKAMSGNSTDLALMMAGFGKMFEAKKDEEVADEEVADEEVEVTDDFSMEEPQGPGKIDVTQNANADLTGTKKDVQDNLEAALEAARALGDEKLATQVGNTITFFNKQHVVKDTPVAEGKEMEEGYYGANTEVEDLAYALNYEGYDTFFQDNPGAVTAVLDWAASIPEFRAKMYIGGLLEAKKEDIKEILLLQKRAGIITETQYKQKLK